VFRKIMVFNMIQYLLIVFLIFLSGFIFGWGISMGVSVASFYQFLGGLSSIFTIAGVILAVKAYVDWYKPHKISDLDKLIEVVEKRIEILIPLKSQSLSCKNSNNPNLYQSFINHVDKHRLQDELLVNKGANLLLAINFDGQQDNNSTRWNKLKLNNPTEILNKSAPKSIQSCSDTISMWDDYLMELIAGLLNFQTDLSALKAIYYSNK
jgi:hypothetical protein